MNKINDLDIKDWKNSDILTDSLWLIPERDKTGKHHGYYHGNFIPQIPYQLIKRYTKIGEVIFDPFIGSGTTSFEAERLSRKFIGIDIQPDLIQKLNNQLTTSNYLYEYICADSSQVETYEKVRAVLKKHNQTSVHLAILHPPYFDIIKFSDNPRDLSMASSLEQFIDLFTDTLRLTISILEKKRYLAIVIGDKYSKGEWIPLGFYCMQLGMKLGLKLKSIIVKDIQNNRGKRNQNNIWRYRALSSDYYIFKHEYIMVYKKE